MVYSQKYTLVSFLHQQAEDAEFDMQDWPLHVTLADVFAIDLEGTDMVSKLVQLLSAQPAVSTKAKDEADFGTTRVVLLEQTDALRALHLSLVDLLSANGAVFNSPEFTKDGFLPHCTIHKTSRLTEGALVHINSISLVDMFVNGNWQQRKVIKTFKFR